jgi:hypothetical protein
MECVAKVLGGKNNLNLFAYASLPQDGTETLLTQAPRTVNAHRAQHGYMINYLTPEPTDLTHWRLRLRKNPGLVLLAEAQTRQPAIPADGFQQLVYVFDGQGVMRFYVNGHLLLAHTDTSYTAGFFGLRNFGTLAQYRHVKIYRVR